MASLLKTIHVVNRGLIPPTANFKRLNPKITWNPSLYQVPNSDAVAIKSENGVILASLSSFGIGGANGHVVLESPPAIVAPSLCNTAQHHIVFIAGGLSPKSAQRVAEELRDHLLTRPAVEWPAIGTVYGRRSRQMTWRTSFCAIAGAEALPQIDEPVLCAPSSPPPVIFVFSGQGPQHIDMGRQIVRDLPGI
jgi:acyl transferase domain-containing protein